MIVILIKFYTLLILIVSTGYWNIQDNQPQCIDCHSDITAGIIKHPDLETSCDLCHSSTGVDHPASELKGFTLADEMPSLCYMCHEEMNTMGFVHYPLQDGECSMCHTPHSSNRAGLILDNLSENICLDCHDINIPEANSVHQPVANGSCTGCHLPHQSEFSALLIKDSQELCSSCHSNLIRGKLAIHAPAESGECTVCHAPHSSLNQALLSLPYPIKLYTESTPENFEICFLCHDTDLLVAETTDWATNFRDTTRNLHYVHINGNKGRSCSICHDMHASDLPFILNNRIDFGSWTMKMQFTRSEDGGTCNTGCHSTKSYSR